MQFHAKRNKFFGTYRYDGLKPNPGKINIIQQLRLPKTQKEIKSFLGLTGLCESSETNSEVPS